MLWLRRVPPFVLVLVLGALLLACDSATAPSGPDAAASTLGRVGNSGGGGAMVERPYGAKFVWTTYAFITAVQSGDPLFGGRCSVRSRYVEFGKVEGEIMHAGRSEGTGSHCVQGTPATGITFTDGTSTFRTANGDLLTVGYGGGTATISNGLVVFESWISVTGGTGRFEGASGTGTQRGVANGLPGDVLRGAPIEFEQTGVISYAPGAR